QVRAAPALRTQHGGSHRAAGPRRSGVVPRDQDSGAAMKPIDLDLEMVNIRRKLSTMMFLQFFIWGAWYTTIAVFMTSHGMGTLTYWPYTVNPIAAFVAPFFLGLIADRYFPTEKVLGTLHILGGLVMFIVPRFTGSPTIFIGLLLLYNLCYMPTLGLANCLAFHHIQD